MFLVHWKQDYFNIQKPLWDVQKNCIFKLRSHKLNKFLIQNIWLWYT